MSAITVADFLKLDAKKLAIQHNDELIKMVKYQDSHPNATPRDILFGYGSSLSNDDLTTVFNNADRNHDAQANFNYVLGQLKTTRGKEVYTNIFNAIASTTTYADLIAAVDRELAGATKDLSGFDLQAVKIFAETSKKFGDYWYNISLSGKRPPRWVTQDGCGIAQASVGWAVAAGIFGGGPATYFVACGVGGALASIFP